jgi:hypothetical protein
MTTFQSFMAGNWGIVAATGRQPFSGIEGVGAGTCIGNNAIGGSEDDGRATRLRGAQAQ